ncbi:LMBR1-like membrane protein-domain-containing protein [Halteromyces radiatus]|uniref:LMBR1-like membrane protein-domain-containing protein n=1 Tax=Halteromyces radiatus TaxID=101107 RepID=UPI00221F887C|nr:LMBR1-like membrane protein-domain-containing protein [Halteromyces radiatus]KAI8081328.1 LMBR1-like membrane protein-domain-containing protein [Halteromyces radiatus]
MIEESNWVPLVFSILGLFFLVASLVFFYSNIKTQPWYVSIVSVIGWFFPFWIVLLLPLDMASSLYEGCDMLCRRPFTWVSQSFLYIAWRTIYWTSFCLTWMLIPMMQAYVNSGDIKVIKRLKSAAQVNIRFYMIYVIIGIIGLIYLFFKGGITTREDLQGFVMAMANSWGLFLVIMFMGYGLIAVPRKLWYASDTKRHLNELYKKAPRVKEECMDSELEFDELAKTINAISHRPLRNDPNLRHMVDETVKRFPFVKHPHYAEREYMTNIPQLLTEDYIVTLNKNMILAARMKDRKSALWKNLLSEAFYLQDIETNKGNSDRHFYSTLRPLEEQTFWTDTKLIIEWWWVIMFRSVVYRGLSILFSLISICILWSELTFNVKSPVVSIVGLAIKACGLNYAAVEVLSFLILTWMCICVYTSLFKIRFFNLYLLIPHHHTDPNSLLWFTGYMCKMMAPLCYNYINLLGNIDSHQTGKPIETVFSKFMGKADLVPFLGTTFIDWFPVVILIPALSAFFNVSSSKWFKDNNEADPENGGQLNVDVAEGKDLVMEERRLLERNFNHDISAPPGLLDRAKNVFGAYSSKYGRTQQSGHAASSSFNNEEHHVGTLASSLRQKRDDRLDAILGRRPINHVESSSVNHRQTDQGGEQVPLNVKWQTFGDNMKHRFGQLFTSTNNNNDNNDNDLDIDGNNHINNRYHDNPRNYDDHLVTTSSPPSPPSSSSPPPSTLPKNQITRPTVQGGGRVFGRVNNSNTSRASSPNPFQKATTARGNQATTVSPFARFDDNNNNMSTS